MKTLLQIVVAAHRSSHPRSLSCSIEMNLYCRQSAGLHLIWRTLKAAVKAQGCAELNSMKVQAPYHLLQMTIMACGSLSCLVQYYGALFTITVP